MSYSKNIKLNIVFQYSNTLLNFLVSIFLTRILSDSGRGEYALYSNFIALSVLFFSFSITSGLINKISSKQLSINSAFRISIIYFFIAVVFFSIILFFLDGLGNENILVAEKNQVLIIY